MPKIAWQTPVVGLLLITQFGLGALEGAAAIPASGITLTPLVALVAIPTTLFGLGWALNQLKSIGAAAPGTTETKTVEVVATPPGNKPA
jgi:hypothetical protein